MDNLLKLIGTVVIGGFVVVVGLLLGSVLLAYPLKWAWNYVIPRLFGLPPIGALEAFCLSWVTSVLFKPSVQLKKS